MKALDALAHTVQRLFPPPSSAQRDEERDTRPFFIVVMVVLAFLYGWALYTQPALRAPAPLILFTGVMVIHATLHWFSARLTGTLRAGVVYLAVQGALAFALIVLAREVSMVLGLYASL